MQAEQEVQDLLETIIYFEKGTWTSEERAQRHEVYHLKGRGWNKRTQTGKPESEGEKILKKVSKNKEKNKLQQQEMENMKLK